MAANPGGGRYFLWGAFLDCVELCLSGDYMNLIRLGRYVAPKNNPQAYAVVASITIDGKVKIRFLDDKDYHLHSYDPDDLELLPRGVVTVRKRSSIES